MSALTMTPPPVTPNTARAAGKARVRDEVLVPLDEAAKYVPARNARGHASTPTLLRWLVRGRLDAVRVRGVWHTSADAVARALAGKGGGR